MNPYTQPVTEGDDETTVWAKIATAYGVTLPQGELDVTYIVKLTCAHVQGTYLFP